MHNRPTLSLAQIDAYDPQGPQGRKWCPLCGDGKPKDAAHRSLSIERGNGLWKCFRCGSSGQAREFWAEKPAVASRHAQRQALQAAFQMTPPGSILPARVEAPVASSGEPPRPSDWKEHWDATLPLENTPGAAYLAARGLPLATTLLAQVRWSPSWSGHPAVVFPIHDRGGVLIAAQARAISGAAKLTAGPKKEGAFLAPVAMQSERVCGPLDEAVPAVILVEAPIDALSLAACGFPSLALCGTSGPRWLHLACGLRRVALGFDADDAGERAATDIRRILEPFGARCARLRPEGGKDWNEWLVKDDEELMDWLAAALLAG
jgi:hypothetical protein